MLHRFAAATAVAAVVVMLADVGLPWLLEPGLAARYTLTSIWTAIPFVWGVWAMLAPSSWFPDRLWLWGAILGLIAAVVAVFVLDVPSLLTGLDTKPWQAALTAVIAIGLYSLLWRLVQAVHRALTEARELTARG